MSKDLLLEIGTEEVPAHVMPHLLDDLKRLAGDMFAERRLAYESLHTLGTPRRCDGTRRAPGGCEHRDARSLSCHCL